MADKIIVLDFGSQYNQLITRRIRDFGVYSELVSADLSLEKILDKGDVKGIIFSGGPNSVYEDGAPKCDPAIFESGLPILGICYGMQLTHFLLGGEVISSNNKEYGLTYINCDDCLLFKGLDRRQKVWMSHGDQVKTLAPGFKLCAISENGPIVATYNLAKKIYTVQFHPEVRDSENGLLMLKNFIFTICGAQGDWSMQKFIAEEMKAIKEEVKDNHVLLALSGGVDSSVTALLLSKALGNKLHCMFIDHGLLRKNEAQEVEEMCRSYMSQLDFIKIDASQRFLSKLKGVSDPETKRKIIGKEFIATFNEEVNKLLKKENITYLAQGTLYTDVIESGTKTAQTIKSHHNVGGLPKDLKFKLIEPLRTLFKDEVRQLGRELGMEEKIVNRQPFPGPGLGIRVVGEIVPERLEIVRESDAILREEIKKANLDKDIWQYFTACLNNKAVGVMGDQRTYAYTVAIRAVTSIDGMSADWARIPYEVLARISNRIVNEVRGCNRVVYDISSKPPGTIEWE